MSNTEPPWEVEGVAQLRVPPHSVDAEVAVLGSLLLDNTAFDRMGDLLAPADFYRHEHRLVYEATAKLCAAARPADVLTVYDQLQAGGHGAEVGGLAYLNSLAQAVPNARNVRRYAEIVRDRSIQRQLITASDEIATLAFNPGSNTVAGVLDAAERKVFAVAQSRGTTVADWVPLGSAMLQVVQRIEAQTAGGPVDYIATGLGELDERLDGGLRGGELVIIGARPSMGKTALAMNIAETIACQYGLPVGIFSMEMPGRQLAARFLAKAARIHLSRIRRPERLRDDDWPEIMGAMARMEHAPIEICDLPALSIVQLRSKARTMARRLGKMGALVVDYLSLMAGTDPRMPRPYQLQEVTNGAKSLAKELDCPVLLLQQISRAVEGRDDQMPMMSDLKDAGSAEQDADVIMFIHRQIVAEVKLADENTIWRNYARLKVAKLRDGEPGEIALWYEGQHVQFRDWDPQIEIPRKLGRSAPKL